MITIDIETVDPNLHTLGDGSVRKDGGIICVGMWFSDRNCGYVYDWTDEHERGQCTALLESDEDKCFHNGLYDLAWLVIGYGVKVGGVWHDTMTRQALIDEYMDLDLDTCCKKMGVKGKNKDETIELWYKENKDVLGLVGTVWQNIDVLMQWPAFKERLFGYNLQDCKAANDLFWAQEPYMHIGRISEAYGMECQLYPLIIQMKKTGVRLDVGALDALTEHVQADLNGVVAELQERFSLTPEIIRSTKQLGEYYNMLGIHSPLLTPKGGESWSANALDRLIGEHPSIVKVQEYKAKATLIDKYLLGSLRKSLIGDRIHCTFSPNKRDDGGTITGRFASSHPNMQNISAREEKHGQKTYGSEMRSLFIPEDGCWMSALDYSQIEFLLFVANAYGEQAKWLKGQARAGVDFHDMAMGITGLQERFPVKCINYGTIYGMGLAKLKQQHYTKFQELSKKAGVSFDSYIDNIYNTYHTKLPVIKATMKHLEQVCVQQGYVEGLSGRRHHKPKAFISDGRINDGIYKVTNYKLQGDAADMVKMAMLQSYKDGVFNTLTLHLQVHDELVQSVPKRKEGLEALMQLKTNMRKAFMDRLDVPVHADGGLGSNWHEGKENEQLLADMLNKYGVKEAA